MKRAPRTGGALLIDDRSVPENDWIDETMHRLDCLHDVSRVRQYRASRWDELLESAGLQVDTVEPHTKHRPVTALTARVSVENVMAIRTILDNLSRDQRTKLDLQLVDGEERSTYWYVMIAATVPKVQTCDDVSAGDVQADGIDT